MTWRTTPLLTGIAAVLTVGAVTVTAFSFGTASSFREGLFSWALAASDNNNNNSGPPVLPADVVKYSQVPKEGTFTADKIPKGLLKDHTTKAGTWGIIRVYQGTLEYTIQEPELLVMKLQAPAAGVIEPQTLHHVKALTDDVKFVVEFYRKPGTGPVDEKREGL